jgi:FkbM family methyltransferase
LYKSRRRLEELLWICGLNKISTPLWELARGWRALQQNSLIREFYSRLIPSGALVFDIGANLGTLTRVFESIGAKVIAVEPNPDCLRHIELTTSTESVKTLQAAIGEKGGLGVIQVSDRKDKMSSLSESWREAMSNENSHFVGLWKRELTVPIVTLDSMVERFGRPFYVKIDVEGYEEQVLKGLSYCPPLLSFEFNKSFFDPALRSLESPLFEQAEFNFTLVDPAGFELHEWVNLNTLKRALVELGNGKGLGDIFVRASEPSH